MNKIDSARCPGCMSPIEIGGACPVCEYSPSAGHDARYLRPSSLLNDGRYFVGCLSSKNGGGATYLGFDNQSGKTCWINEYFPTKLARRNKKTGAVYPNEGQGAQFKALISDFVDVCNEVKRFAVTENVIPILDVFYENNTCYAIYERMKVITLDDFLGRAGGKLPLGKALEMFIPFCNMLANIHDRGFIHRGISPYTIYVDESGSLYLWDFSLGAARTANSELDAELFNGYSAPEQYSTSAWQGAWTDIYGLAAVFYRMVSGFVPPKSVLVGDDRPITPLDDLVIDMPNNISDAIADAMEIQTEKRTQSVYSLTSRLMESENTNTAVYDTFKTKQAKTREERADKDGGFKYAILALIFTVTALICGFVYMTKTIFPEMLGSPSSTPSSSQIQTPPELSEPEPESASSGEDARVPRFVGQMLSVVQNDDDYSGLYDFAVQEEYNGEFPTGVIFKQSPEADTLMPNRGTVILYVSKGPELSTMPSIVGMQWDEALNALGQENLSCDRVERYVAGAAPGSVVGTSPQAGAKFDPLKEPVTVYVMPYEEPSSASSAKSSSKSSSSSKASSGSKSSSSSKASSSSKP